MVRKIKTTDEEADLERLHQQEELIVSSLGLSQAEQANRVLIAKYFEDIDMALFGEPLRLFPLAEESEKKLEGKALIKEIERLIYESAIIYEIAIRCHPSLTFDKIRSFLSYAEKLINYINFNDYDVKRSYMILLKEVVRIQEKEDMVALADCFLVDIPAALNSIIVQLTGKSVKKKDIFRQRVAKNPKPYDI